MNNTENNEIGQRIRKLRKEHKLSQTELANKIGKSLRTIQKYENGEIEVAISVMNEIAAALDITVADIIGYNAETNTIQSLSDIMNFLFSLEKVRDVDFRIDVKKPPHCDEWECSLVFSGKDSPKHNSDICLFLERWAEERENFKSYFSSLADYRSWQSDIIAYYCKNKLETVEPTELDFETRMTKRKEYVEAELKKKKGD